jgi:hypothetical protein
MPQKAPTVHHRYTNVASRKVSNREALPPSELGAESERMAGRGVGRAEEARSASSARPRLCAGGSLAVPGSDQVILGVCLARLVCWVDRGQATGDGRYLGPQFGGLDDLDVRAEPEELGLGVLG